MSQFYKASVEIEYEDTFDTDESPWEVADDILRDLKSDIEEMFLSKYGHFIIIKMMKQLKQKE